MGAGGGGQLCWLTGSGDDPIGCGSRWQVVVVLESCTAAVLVGVMRLDPWATPF